MSKAPGFFATFFSLCRSTECAPVIVRNPFWKVLLQFVLLAAILSFLVAIGQYVRIQRWIEDSQTSFTGTFGPSIIYRDNGFYPSNEENKARSIVLPNCGRLCYTGKTESPKESIADLGGLQYLVLWHNGRFSIANRVDENRWSVIHVGETKMMKTFSGDRATLDALFQEVDPATQKTKEKAVYHSVADIANLIRWICFIVAFLQHFLITIVLGFFWTGILTLLFSIANHRMLRGINLWKSVIYAGFPAMLIAAFFPMLDLPLFSYYQVYLFAMLVYWIYIARRIETTWQQESQHDSKGDFYDN